MAEKLKELLNKTFKLSDVAGDKLTLFSTDTTTQAVIRDITYQSTMQNGTLLINDTPIIPLNRNVSGSEVIDVNSRVQIQMPYNVTTDLLSFELLYQLVSDKLQIATFSSLGSLKLSDSKNDLAVKSGFSNPVDCWQVNGDFYYCSHDGNSVTDLYKNEGGPSGGRSLINSENYAYKVFDGVSKFYWARSGRLYHYDTVTKTASSVSFPDASASSFARAAFSNGVFFSIRGISYLTSVYYINVTTGQAGKIHGINNINILRINPNAVFEVVFYNNRFSLIYTSNSGNFFVITLKSAIAMGHDYLVTRDTATFKQSDFPAPRKNDHFGRLKQSLFKPGAFDYVATNGKLYTVDLQGKSSTYYTLPDSINTTSYCFNFVKKANAPLSTFPQKMRVRITGVEITGVS